MQLKFCGNYAKLQKCVSRTRLGGKWRELKNNHKQFRTYDNGILNWWESRGTITFQGEESAAIELERSFTKIASAKGLLHSKHSKQTMTFQDSTKEADELKELIAEARIQRRKLKTLVKRADIIAGASKW
jgi:hypothetical protein